MSTPTTMMRWNRYVFGAFLYAMQTAFAGAVIAWMVTWMYLIWRTPANTNPPVGSTGQDQGFVAMIAVYAFAVCLPFCALAFLLSAAAREKFPHARWVRSGHLWTALAAVMVNAVVIWITKTAFTETNGLIYVASILNVFVGAKSFDRTWATIDRLNQRTPR